jgi:hypothetical protein
MSTTEEWNPYTATSAVPLDRTGGLRRRSVLVVIVFQVVTFGLYLPIWFLRRRAALNRLDSPRTVEAWPFSLFLAVVMLQVVLELVATPEPVEQMIGDAGSLALTVMQLGVGLLMLVQCFKTKDILEDHLAGPGDAYPASAFANTVKLSWPMTFFFQIIYLQYVINRDILGSRVKGT